MIFHAFLALLFAALSLFACVLLIKVLACLFFAAAVWEMFMLIWALRPVRYRAWCMVLAGQRGKFTISWMSVPSGVL